jgi:hypothetical protein
MFSALRNVNALSFVSMLAISKPTKSKLPSAADLFNSVDTASFMVGAGGKRKVGARFHLYVSCWRPGYSGRHRRSPEGPIGDLQSLLRQELLHRIIRTRTSMYSQYTTSPLCRSFTHLQKNIWLDRLKRAACLHLPRKRKQRLPRPLSQRYVPGEVSLKTDGQS